MQNYKVYNAYELNASDAGSMDVENSTVAEEVSRGDVGFTPDSLEWSLPIMGQGMLGIFIVTAIIVTVTVVLNKATAPRKKNKEKKDK